MFVWTVRKLLKMRLVSNKLSAMASMKTNHETRANVPSSVSSPYYHQDVFSRVYHLLSATVIILLCETDLP